MSTEEQLRPIPYVELVELVGRMLLAALLVSHRELVPQTNFKHGEALSPRCAWDAGDIDG